MPTDNTVIGRQTVHAGHTIVIKIKGQKIGRAQGLDGRRGFGTEGVYEVGSIMPQELIVTRYEGSLSVEKFMIRKQDLAKLNLVSLGEEVLKSEVIDIELIDKQTGETFRVYRGCVIQDYSENIRAGAICGENATFLYLSCDDGTTAAGAITNDAATIHANSGTAALNAIA